MRIIATTDADFEQQLSRITGRMELLEQAQPPAVRKKTVEVFGRPLSPSEVVREIIADVRSKGDEAVFDYARRLDGLQLDSETVRVPQDEIDSACIASSLPFSPLFKRRQTMYGVISSIFLRPNLPRWLLKAAHFSRAIARWK